MNRTLLIRLLAVLAIVISVAMVVRQVSAGEAAPVFPRMDDDALVLQAEHDGARFLSHFNGGSWRSLPAPARHVWSTLRFELQATMFDGIALHPPDALAPTVAELEEAYQALQVPEMVPLLATYGDILAGHEPAAADLGLWRGRIQKLGAQLTDARRTYLQANLPVITGAMAR